HNVPLQGFAPGVSALAARLNAEQLRTQRKAAGFSLWIVEAELAVEDELPVADHARHRVCEAGIPASSARLGLAILDQPNGARANDLRHELFAWSVGVARTQVRFEVISPSRQENVTSGEVE